MRRALTIFALILACVVTATLTYRWWTASPPAAAYRLAKAERGAIVAMVNATGSINPTTTVIVSSQLSGQVVDILADYNSVVNAGQVVARLNSDQIRARLDGARADLAQIRATKLLQEAQVDRATADIERGTAVQADAEAQIVRNEALLADAEANFQRQSNLRAHGYGVTPEATYDTARAQRDAQRASLASSRAQLASAKAQLAGYQAELRVAQAQVAAASAQILQKEATVRQIEVDLRNTEIRSPVSGVVVQRNVELGQTVAASLQAPTLFLIADDLRHMEISAHIDETDIGRVKPGQQVNFTVNAYPARSFTGTVKQVRLGSQTVQNVVIYTTIISVENPRHELMPGMTANLRIETDRRDDALRVPNAALRWRPPAADASVTATAPESAGDRGSPRAGGGSGLTDLIASLRAELELDADQAREVDAAMAEARAALAAGQSGDDTGVAERRERSRAARTVLESRIAAVLTGGQRKKFDEIRQRHAGTQRAGQTGRVFLLGQDGKPQPLTLRIGATDGVMTEVLSGNLQPGQDIIVGGGPRLDATGAQRPTFGPRFGL